MIALLIAAALQTAPSHWLVEDTTSALDGRRTYAAAIESDTPVLNQVGQPEKATLVVACIRNERQVLLQWPRFVTTRGAQVEWKVGDGPVQRDTFLKIGDRNTQLAGRDLTDFWSAMQGEGQAVLRVMAYENQQETTFDLTGARAALAAAEAACPARR